MKGKGKKAALEVIPTDDSDVFILRDGDGHLTVAGFEPGSDRIMFDFNSYSDVLGPLGRLSDGLTFTDFTGLTTIQVNATDTNNDGITDTTFTVGDDSITLLGIAPSDLYSGSLMGG
jgi:hypothetical protein